MNSSRRSFFKLFGAAAAITAVAPSVLLPRAADAFRWKVRKFDGHYFWVLNPEWISATHKIIFFHALELRNGLFMAEPMWPDEGENSPLTFRRDSRY